MAKDILIGWCDNGTVESRFMDGILSLYMAKERGELDVNLNATHTMGNQIFLQRQQMIEGWEETGIEWFLSVDTDVVITPQHFKQLLEIADKDKAPVVCGIYFVSPNLNDPLMTPMPCIFKQIGHGFKPIHPLPINQKIEVDAAGMGLVLMHKSILPKLKEKYPDGVYFDTALGEKSKGEDLSFFMKLKEIGVKVIAHTGVIGKHMKRFCVDENYYSLWWQTVGAQIQQTQSGLVIPTNDDIQKLSKK